MIITERRMVAFDEHGEPDAWEIITYDYDTIWIVSGQLAYRGGYHSSGHVGVIYIHKWIGTEWETHEVFRDQVGGKDIGWRRAETILREMMDKIAQDPLAQLVAMQL